MDNNSAGETRARLVRALHNWAHEVGRLVQVVEELERQSRDALVQVAARREGEPYPDAMPVDVEALTAGLVTARSALTASELAGRRILATLQVETTGAPARPVTRRSASDVKRKKALELLEKQRRSRPIQEGEPD